MNEKKFDVRIATLADADAIASVHVQAWNESYRGLVADEVIDARTVDVRRRQWMESLGSVDRVTMLARRAGETVGFAGALLLDPPIEGFAAYLQALYVLESVKGRGVGKALLRALANSLQANGCTKLVLRTLRLNPSSRGFYEHLGARLLPQGSSIEAGRFDDVAYAFDDIGVLCA